MIMQQTSPTHIDATATRKWDNGDYYVECHATGLKYRCDRIGAASRFYAPHILYTEGLTGTWSLNTAYDGQSYHLWTGTLKTASAWSRRNRNFFHLEKKAMQEAIKWCKDCIPDGWKLHEEPVLVNEKEQVNTSLSLELLNDTDALLFHLRFLHIHNKETIEIIQPKISKPILEGEEGHWLYKAGIIRK